MREAETVFLHGETPGNIPSMSDFEPTFLNRVLADHMRTHTHTKDAERFEVRVPRMLMQSIRSEANARQIPINQMLVAVLRATFTGEK